MPRCVGHALVCALSPWRPIDSDLWCAVMVREGERACILHARSPVWSWLTVWKFFRSSLGGSLQLSVAWAVKGESSCVKFGTYLSQFPCYNERRWEDQSHRRNRQPASKERAVPAQSTKRGRQRTCAFDRFMAKVQRNDETGCWLWLGNRAPSGHGRFDGAPAYRWIWEYMNDGPLPRHLVVDHLCNNPSCVNIAHLQPVTVMVNTQRALQRRPRHNALPYEYRWRRPPIRKFGDWIDGDWATWVEPRRNGKLHRLPVSRAGQYWHIVPILKWVRNWTK